MLKFKVSRTYQHATPESASEGDYSDTGYVFEDRVYTLSELKAYIRSEGFGREGRTGWMETDWSVVDYSTGTEGSESLHVELIKAAV
jgi:hypothetical protein